MSIIKFKTFEIVREFTIQLSFLVSLKKIKRIGKNININMS